MNGKMCVVVLLAVSAVMCRADGLRVAVCGAAYGTYVEDVQSNIAAARQFAAVDALDVQWKTPALTTLQNYAAVLVFSDWGYHDPTNFGNVLADYVDGGGGVVAMIFEVASLAGYQAECMLHGRWETGGYVGIPRGEWIGGVEATLGTVYQPAHPIMDGVTNFSGGVRSYRPETNSVVAGWERVADWSDGKPLVVAGAVNGGRVVNLGFYPPSDKVNANYWRHTTQGGLLMANALAWAAMPEPAGMVVVCGWLVARGMRRQAS